MPLSDRDRAVIANASEVFDQYAAMDAPEVPRDPLSALQVMLVRWQTRNFGSADVREQTLGVCEEAGELAHAILKGAQGIRGLDNREKMREEAGDAIADCAVYLMQVCTALRLDFGTLLHGIAQNVLNRDWKRDPNGGGS